MPTHTAAVIGTGPDPAERTREGWAMAYPHGEAYRSLEDVELVACADLVPERARAFADRFDLPDDAVFADAATMLSAVEPTVASVCTPPATHADIVIEAARTGAVGAIHCEKPMAVTWGDCRLLAQEADRRDVQLTFNHQRRFGRPFREAKRLLDEGEIGDLDRIEMGASNLFDYGVHSVDLCNYFADQASPDWVLGGIDYREENVWFGQHNENQAFVQWRYEGGVRGLAATGGVDAPPLVDPHHRLVGSDGVIEVGPGFVSGSSGPPLRVRRAGAAEWEVVDCGDEGLHGIGRDEPDTVPYIARGIEDALDALETGLEPESSARNVLDAMEIVLGAYESARRRGRVDFPLRIDDNPLESMVAEGLLLDREGDGDA